MHHNDNSSMDNTNKVNGKNVFYKPDNTNPYYIYYNTGETRWCLSTCVNGECKLFGPTGSNTVCPDLDATYFGLSCPTPTPSNTDACNTFDFTAVFDCNITSGATPTPTPTLTPTNTPTTTPTPTPLCNGKSLSFSGINYSYPGPSPTPSVTPTNAAKLVNVSGSVVYDTFSSKFTSLYSKLLLDCNSSNKYVVGETIPFNTGATFSAVIDFKSSTKEKQDTAESLNERQECPTLLPSCCFRRCLSSTVGDAFGIRSFTRNWGLKSTGHCEVP
jgi:hypothetical protein